MNGHKHLSRKEKKEIRKERKQLRKKLKAESGIKSKRDFEEICQMLGLVIYDDNGPIPWIWFWRIKDKISNLTLIGLLGFLISVIFTMFLYASLANQKGNFIIYLSNDIINANFELSDDETFDNPKVLLKSPVLMEVNPYTINDLPAKLDNAVGNNSFNNVVAYTFWIRNNGDKEYSIDWHTILNNSTKNVSEAVWIMLFKDGELSIYAKKNEDDTRAKVDGLSHTWPYYSVLKDKESCKEIADGVYSIEATEYESDRLVTSEYELSMKPGEKHKFTVVIWVEGYDEDCTESILGGHAGYSMTFVEAGDKNYLNNVNYSANINEELDDIKDNKLIRLMNKIKEDINFK